MNDTPGWASPGSAPSGGQEPDAPGPAEPADRPAGATVPSEPADRTGPRDPAQDSGPSDGTGQPGENGQDGPPPRWSKEQPPPARWSAPGAPGTDPSGGQATPPPSAPGWGDQPPAGPGGAPGWGGQGPGGQGPGGQGPGGPGWGGRPPYGPGGGPGWGGWQGRPTAAKPGVIPLRPLGVGEILDGAVSTMRTYWRTVLGISLSVAVITEIAVVLLQGLVLDDRIDTEAINDESATLGELTRAMGDILLSTGVVLLVTLLGTIVATALLTTVTSRAVLGKSVTTAEAWRDARPQLPRLFGLTFLLPLIAVLIIGVGTLPGLLIAAVGSTDAGVALAVLGGLAAAVVAVWLMIRFSLASPTLMLEKRGVVKSLNRSAKLVRGSWWRVLGIQLLASIIANIVASIILLPFSLIAGAVVGDGIGGFLDTGSGQYGWTYLVISGIGSVIGSTLTFPITAGVTVLLYIDQRIRREALDLELARAAGIQGAGPGATPGG